MRFIIMALSLLSLAACAHEAENTGADNASNTITMTGSYAMAALEEKMPDAVAHSDEAAKKDPAAYTVLAAATPAVLEDSPVAEGSVSRYQRQVYVPGGPDGEMTPCAKNFDAIMDHLELLMADKIAENNAIAEKQAAMPRYSF